MFKRVYNTTSSRGVFQYVIEVYVIHMIMKRKKIDFSQYRKVQEDIDNVMYVPCRCAGCACITVLLTRPLVATETAVPP